MEVYGKYVSRFYVTRRKLKVNRAANSPNYIKDIYYDAHARGNLRQITVSRPVDSEIFR